ncbi:hypothetical protein HMPREF0742_02756 [Rothia aeria F0184]|uniref:Uncharacterized protein n=1 Tax=Rothia aeria F0184 TaxID=888019 RepID=U7UVX1_9MICC|nr:hypothetical protein HMPREF0742_02756 [Rothia aeria F0184]
MYPRASLSVVGPLQHANLVRSGPFTRLPQIIQERRRRGVVEPLTVDYRRV